MTVEEYRKQIRDQFIESVMRNQNISRGIIISPYKVESYYRAHQADFNVDNQVKLRMITLNKTGDGTATLRMAQEILAEIKGGATFQEMATLYSQDAQQRHGGDRGWVDRTVLRPELANAAFALKPGQTTDVIDLPEACYLLHVDQTSTSHIKKLADVRASIEKILVTEEQKRLKKQWIDSLMSKTYVQRFF
jgi:parvulin-like peptidyl-prolyl isomerase